MSGSKYWRVASFLAVGSLLLAACGQAATPIVQTVVVNQTSVVEKTVQQTVEVPKEVVVTATPAPTEGPTAVPAAQPSDTVVIGQQQEPSTLHPMLQSESAASIVLAPVVVGCMGQDNSLPPKWLPLGCETVPTIDNGGAKMVGDGADQHLELTYKIKQGWRWTDGTPVKASDAVYAWKIAMDPDMPVAARNFQEEIYSVTAVDDSTYLVKIMSESQAKAAAAGTLKGDVAFDKFKDDYAVYASQSGPLVDPVYWADFNPSWLPEHILGKIAAKDQAASDYAKKPVGDGPFVITDWKEGQEVDMDASTQPFPLGNPQVKHIIFRFISGGAGPILAAIQNGEIDMVPGNVGGLSTANGPDVDKVTADGKYKVIWNTGYAWEHVDLNTAKAPMDDPAVRNALFYATDRKSIIDKLYNGKNQAVDLPGPTTAQNSWGYTDNYTKHPFDLDKAKQTLKDAGWDCSAFPCTKKGADGKTVPLKFVLMTTTRSDRIQLAQVLQQQWKAIGADANLNFMESRNYFAVGGNGPLSAGTFDAGIYTWQGGDDPQFYQLYSCSQVPTKANGYAGQNNSRWCNKDADAALKASEATTLTLSRDSRKPLIEKFFQAFASEVPVIPLYAATEPLVYRVGLTNFKPGLTQNSVATWNTWEWSISK